MRLHFGLGSVQTVDAIKVRWPNGREETFTARAINQIIELKEGMGS
jgi:enediyne biosynthesis protein E4